MVSANAPLTANSEQTSPASMVRPFMILISMMRVSGFPRRDLRPGLALDLRLGLRGRRGVVPADAVHHVAKEALELDPRPLVEDGLVARGRVDEADLVIGHLAALAVGAV